MEKHKIPTLLGIFLLIIAIGATVLGFKTLTGFFSKASPELSPKNVRITNVTENSFTVSYITDEAVISTLALSSGQIFPDDRDTDIASSKPYLTHYFTVKNLKAATSYTFKLTGGSETNKITTAPALAAPTSTEVPVYGTVTNPDGQPAFGAIVYLNFFDGAPASAQVKSNGNFLITVNNLRSSDLSSYLTLKNNDPETLFIEGGGLTSTVICQVGKDKPFPNIVLGKDVNCNTAVVSLGTQTKTRPVVTYEDSPVEILSPASRDNVSTSLPTFKGTAPAGKIIQIEIHSSSPLSGAIKSDETGNWSWTPPANLPPGEHTATITYIDDSGKEQKIIRNFTVLASDGNDSLLPTTTATPSSQIIPTTTTVTSPVSKPPTTATTGETLVLLTFGLVLATLGISTIFLTL